MEPEDDIELAAEMAEIRNALDSRYDGIVNGKAELIDGQEALAMLRKRIEERPKRMTKP